jgi:hypothetical protein
MEGPAALRWRFDLGHHARIAPQCRWPQQNIYIDAALVLSFADVTSAGYLENTFRSFHEGICLMTSETDKPVAPGTTKVEPAVTPAPQQNQGDAKPSADKPANQQQK